MLEKIFKLYLDSALFDVFRLFFSNFAFDCHYSYAYGGDLPSIFYRLGFFWILFLIRLLFFIPL